MQIVNVDLGDRSYDIFTGSGLLAGGIPQLGKIVAKRKCHIVSDTNVAGLYGEQLARTLGGHGAVISNSTFQAGEQSKNFSTLENILRDMLNAGLDRGSLVVALGGGIPGDVAGFAAAIYMRGIDFIQIPSSLLAMVDSSVGGKTGIDLREGKNLVGAFWQPSLVAADIDMLKTLPERELRCGLAEIVKYGMITDEDLFYLLENNISGLLGRDPELYTAIVARCCKLKADVVSQDEKESGLRAILNYGHSFGHALEAVSDFTIGHGEAIAIGMCMAADLAVSQNMLSSGDAARQEQLLVKLGLPVRYSKLNPETVTAAMSRDKKNRDGRLVLILPRAIGAVTIEKNIDRKLAAAAVENRRD